MQVFISYSHIDEPAKDRLKAHLSQLEREGTITFWHDREILAGNKFDNDIISKLEEAEIFIAFVSPDFLASDYCYEKEMERAFELEKAGKLRIIPVIVEPCDWKSSPLVKFMALPKDGKPILEWDNENNAYLDIVSQIRRLTRKPILSEQTSNIQQSQPKSVDTITKYRVQRNFDEVDKNRFRKETFEEVAIKIENFVKEIDQIDGVKADFDRPTNDSFNCTIVNQLKNNNASSVSVTRSGDRNTLGDISFLNDLSSSGTSANGSFAIENDGYEMFFKSSFYSYNQLDNEKQLTPNDLASIIWNDLLERAEISHA